MFGLLKDKIKGFTDKIFGKTKSKIDSTIEENDKNKVQNDFISKKDDDKSIDTSKVSNKEEIISDKKIITETKKIESDNKTNVVDKNDVNLDSKKISEDQKVDALVKEKPISIKDEKPIKKLEVNKKEEIKSVLPQKEKSKIKSEIKNFNNDKSLEQNKTKISKDKEIDSLVEDKTFSDKNNDFSKDEFVDTSTKVNNKSDEYKSLDLEKKEKIKKNVFTSIKSIFSNKIKLSESEISSFLDDFEFSLLEADVSLDSASNIITDLKQNLTSISYDKNNLLESIKNQIRLTLKKQLNIDCNFENYLEKTKKENEPYIILFIGPNGVGKTTTIAKLGKKYKDQNKKIIFSSSDTFRAGSIQQLEKHGSNLDIRVIKQDYGSDPAAVAYDAVSAAKASKSDFVFIDTAGRQETNHNLMQELEKIKRVVKPNLTIYVAESQAGQAVVEQIRTFDEKIGIDGAILTKIDTDPKGGVAISILNELKKPIFFIGTGQEYNELITFSADYIIDRIV